MKILVPLKRVPDPDTKIRLKPDGSAVDYDGVKFAVNPFDAIALEEALRLEEKLGEIDVVVVSVGGEECVEQLRTGLAMGADRALLVRAGRDLDSLAIAKILASPDIRELWATLGMETVPSTPEQFAARLRFDYDRYEKLIRSIGLKPQV